MKCFLIPLALGLCLTLQAQKPQEPHKVQKANYEQAARFSTKSLRKMVYSTRIRPNWFAESNSQLFYCRCRHRPQERDFRPSQTGPSAHGSHP